MTEQPKNQQKPKTNADPTPEQAKTLYDVIREDSILLWATQTTASLIASAIPFTNIGPVIVKAFDEPGFRIISESAYRGLQMDYDTRIFLPLQRYFNKTYTPNILDARTVVSLYAQGRIDDTAFSDYMAQWGFNGDEAGKFLSASRVLPSMRDLTVMRWRGLTTLDTIKKHPTYLSINPDDRDTMLAIQEPIPGSGDLINFVVKEAFPLANLPDAPAEFKGWMAKQGYSEDWSKAYWFSHWRLVPENTVLDLWHRGFITSEQATKYLVLHDFPTFKRPGQDRTDTEMVLEASYSLLPRIDLRFGWFTGTLSEEEMTALYGKYGFKSEDAVKEISIQKARVLDIYRRDYLSTLRLAYRRGKISGDAFKAAVKNEHFPDEVADWIIKSEDLRTSVGAGVEASNEERALTKPDLIRLYRRGIIGQEKLSTELKQMNYSTEEIALIIADANYVAPVDKISSPRSLTVSELEQLYKRKLRSADWVVAYLDSLHYPGSEIKVIMALWDVELEETRAAEEKAAAKAAAGPTRQFSVGDLESLYKRGLRNLDFIRTYLSGLGYSEVELLGLKALWDYDLEIERQRTEAAAAKAKEVQPRALSVGDLESLYKRGLRSREYVAAYMASLNFPGSEVNAILALWDWDVETSKSRQPSLSEARSMFEQGIISPDEHRDLVAASGVDPAWVGRITEADERTAMRSEIEAVITRNMDLAVDGYLSMDEFEKLIVDMGLGEKLAALWRQRAEIQFRVTRIKAEKTEILNAYYKDIITREDADSALASRGYSDDSRSWDLDIVDLKRMGRSST